MSDMDPFLYGALYGMAKNQQAGNDPNLYRHCHGQHYHSHVGSAVGHVHPVSHSMDYVPMHNLEAWKRGERTTYQEPPFSSSLIWGGLIGFFVGVVFQPSHIGVLIGLILAGVLAWHTIGTKKVPILQYVDGGASQAASRPPSTRPSIIDKRKNP